MPSGAPTHEVETRRILLVDDEVSLLRLMREYLGQQGYEADGCLTGKDALETLRQNEGKYGLVVIDLSLPDLPGDELVRKVQNAYPGLPVLVCSGLPYSVEKLPGRVRFLQKPFLPKMLAQAITSLIGLPK